MGPAFYAVLSRRRTKDLQAHTAFGLLRAFAETENFWAVKLIFYTGTAGIPGVVGWLGACKPDRLVNRRNRCMRSADSVPMCTMLFGYGYTEIRKIPG